MGFRINTNVASMHARRNLEQTEHNLSTTLERLSSGKRITRSASDAAGLGLETNLHAEERGLQQASRNASMGISLIQTAEGNLNEVSSILTRMKELSVQAASDTVGENERQFIDQEFQLLKQEIDRIANVTQYNGTPLLNGQAEGSELRLQVGTGTDSNNSISYYADKIDTRTDNIGISGISLGDQGDAIDALEGIDEAINQVSSMRASLGAHQNRLQSVQNTLSSNLISTTEARSIVGDADVAQESAALAKQSILQSAGVAVLAQANNSPQAALRLL